MHKKHTVSLSSLSGELSLYLSGARTKRVRQLFGCNWCKLISSSSPEEYWRGRLPFTFLLSSHSAFFLSCSFSFSIFLRSLSSICRCFFSDASFSFLSFSLMISTYSFDVSTRTPVMRREGLLSLSSAWGVRNMSARSWGTSPSLTRGFSIWGLQRGVVLCSFQKPAEPDTRGVDVRQPDETWGEPYPSSA